MRYSCQTFYARTYTLIVLLSKICAQPVYYFDHIIIYSCHFTDLEDIMATSTDFNELWYVWQQWRTVAGIPIRDQYLRFVQLSNDAAVNDG